MTTTVTKIVVPEPFEWTDRQFGYAASWRQVRIEAGEYPVEFVDVGWHPRWPDVPGNLPWRAYSAQAHLPCVTVAVHLAAESDTYHWWCYNYEAVVGASVLDGHAELA